MVNIIIMLIILPAGGGNNVWCKTWHSESISSVGGAWGIGSIFFFITYEWVFGCGPTFRAMILLLGSIEPRHKMLPIRGEIGFAALIPSKKMKNLLKVARMISDSPNVLKSWVPQVQRVSAR